MIRWMVLCLGLTLSPLRAEVLPGADAPDLRQAVEAWRAGEEAVALPALALLAGQGNDAARLMLSQIDTGPAYGGAWLAAQDRAARIALMRQPGGISGQSWLDAAGGDLAATWRRLLSADAGPEVVLDFARMGEARAATFAARTLARRQTPGLGTALTAAPDLPAYLARFAGGTWRPEADDPGFLPLTATCTAICGAEAPACTSAMAEALRGDLHMAGPPVAALIPVQDWAQSPVGQAAALRLVALSGWRGEGPACLATALAPLR
ncbi:MAG: hypothetical protein MUF74_00745 [Cypionkella sp.]|nr:hypothetical protein [Cypionkella sp.]